MIMNDHVPQIEKNRNGITIQNYPLLSILSPIQRLHQRLRTIEDHLNQSKGDDSSQENQFLTKTGELAPLGVGSSQWWLSTDTSEHSKRNYVEFDTGLETVDGMSCDSDSPASHEHV